MKEYRNQRKMPPKLTMNKEIEKATISEVIQCHDFKADPAAEYEN